MSRFLLVFLAVALIVALTVMLLGARWGGFITGGVAGILIVLFSSLQVGDSPNPRLKLRNARFRP